VALFGWRQLQDMQYSVQRDALEGRETDGVVSCEVFASVSARLMALLLLPSE